MNARDLRRRSEPLVRYAEPAEFDDVAALLLGANEEYRAIMPPGIFQAYRENLRALVLDPRRHDACEILVIGGPDDRRGRGHRGDGLQGAVALFPKAAADGLGLPGNWAGLRALAVDPAARGRGLGRHLAETAIGRARSLGARILSLHSAPFQVAARNLYLDLGFARCPQYDFDIGDRPSFAGGGERMSIEAFTLNLA